MAAGIVTGFELNDRGHDRFKEVHEVHGIIPAADKA